MPDGRLEDQWAHKRDDNGRTWAGKTVPNPYHPFPCSRSPSHFFFHSPLKRNKSRQYGVKAALGQPSVSSTWEPDP